MRAHGAESLLTSKKLGPYAACVVDELLEANSEAIEVMPTRDPQQSPISQGPTASDLPEETKEKSLTPKEGEISR